MAEGPIMLNARAQIPQAWDALARSSIFGSELLTQVTNYIKFRLWATVVDASIEATTYDPVGQLYAGKLIALQIIPAAADYWSDQLTSETTTGTNETISYPDRIASLWRIHARLLTEVKELSQEFDAVYGRTAVRRLAMPTVSDSDIPYVTVNPYRTTPPLGFNSLYPAALLPWAESGRVTGLPV
jgi:hypothetical protein